MDFAVVLVPYLKWQLVLATGGASVFGLAALTRAFPSFVAARRGLSLAYALMLLATLSPVLIPFLPKPSFVRSSAQIWSGVSSTSGTVGVVPSFSFGAPTPVTSNGTGIPWGIASTTFVLLLLLGGLASLFYLRRDLAALNGLLGRSLRWRKIGRVEILVSDEVSVPFAWHRYGTRLVVVPETCVARPIELRIMVAHELQHHRQGDTYFAHSLRLIETLCFWNPFLRLGGRAIAELQEWACDEALVRERRLEPRAYARCLLEVAKLAVGERFLGVQGFLGRSSAAQLKWRIENMMNIHRRKVRVWPVALIGGLLLGALSAAAAFSQASIVDRRITLERARKLAAKAATSEFPIEVNEAVLARLNRAAGTPEGRKFFRESMERMKEFEPSIDASLKRYGYPAELKAMPIVESGYRNLPPERNPLKCAGIWQVMRSTGQWLGLKVDAQVDERLDVAKSTDASLRYLGAMKLQFQDWRLAVMGFNSGSGVVEKGIAKTGSRDPWRLIQAGFQNDEDYYPKFVAALIVMKNPEILRD